MSELFKEEYVMYAIVPNDSDDLEDYCMIDTMSGTKEESWHYFYHKYKKTQNDDGGYSAKKVHVVVMSIQTH